MPRQRRQLTVGAVSVKLHVIPNANTGPTNNGATRFRMERRPFIRSSDTQSRAGRIQPKRAPHAKRDVQQTTRLNNQGRTRRSRNSPMHHKEHTFFAWNDWRLKTWENGYPIGLRNPHRGYKYELSRHFRLPDDFCIVFTPKPPSQRVLANSPQPQRNHHNPTKSHQPTSPQRQQNSGHHRVHPSRPNRQTNRPGRPSLLDHRPRLRVQPRRARLPNRKGQARHQGHH